MDLNIRTETFNTEDQTWLGSAHGTDLADTITLDGAQLATVFTDGVVPSGVVLGRVTATGRYGRYDAGAADGRQTARGLLLQTVRLRRVQLGDASSVANNVQGALFWHGEVIIANLPTNSGYDTAAGTALPLIKFV